MKMITFKDQSEKSQQVSMDSWLLKLLLRDMKTKTKTKINHQTIIKNNRKVKAMGNRNIIYIYI